MSGGVRAGGRTAGGMPEQQPALIVRRCFGPEFPSRFAPNLFEIFHPISDLVLNDDKFHLHNRPIHLTSRNKTGNSRVSVLLPHRFLGPFIRSRWFARSFDHARFAPGGKYRLRSICSLLAPGPAALMRQAFGVWPLHCELNLYVKRILKDGRFYVQANYSRLCSVENLTFVACSSQTVHLGC